MGDGETHQSIADNIASRSTYPRTVDAERVCSCHNCVDKTYPRDDWRDRAATSDRHCVNVPTEHSRQHTSEGAQTRHVQRIFHLLIC